MRPWPGLSLLFLLLFTLACLLQWPAAWLASRLEDISHQHWRLAGAHGTLWNGSGMLMTTSATQGEWRNVQEIRWQLRANALWRGQLNIDLQTEQGEAHVLLSPRGWSIENFDLTLPADEIIGQLEGAFGRYGWSGLLHTRGKHLACDWPRHDCLGEAILFWKDAAAREIHGPVWGSYQLRLVGEGPALRIDLSTLQGRLKLSGQGELANSGKLNLSIEADTQVQNTSPPEIRQDESLERLLASLGRARGNGKYLLEYRDYTH